MSERADTYLSPPPPLRKQRPRSVLKFGRWKGQDLQTVIEIDERYTRWLAIAGFVRDSYHNLFREVLYHVARMYGAEAGELRAQRWIERHIPYRAREHVLPAERVAAYQAETGETIDKFVDTAQLLAGVARKPGGAVAFRHIRELLEIVEQRDSRFIDSEV